MQSRGGGERRKGELERGDVEERAEEGSVWRDCWGDCDVDGLRTKGKGDARCKRRVYNP